MNSPAVVSLHNVTLGQKYLMPDGKKQALATGKVSEVDWLKDVVQKRLGWQVFINNTVAARGASPRLLHVQLNQQFW